MGKNTQIGGETKSEILGSQWCFKKSLAISPAACYLFTQPVVTEYSQRGESCEGSANTQTLTNACERAHPNTHVPGLIHCYYILFFSRSALQLEVMRYKKTEALWPAWNKGHPHPFNRFFSCPTSGSQGSVPAVPGERRHRHRGESAKKQRCHIEPKNHSHLLAYMDCRRNLENQERTREGTLQTERSQVQNPANYFLSARQQYVALKNTTK